MYPGKGTYIPINQNGMERPAKQQAELDQMMQEFLDWKKETELSQYEAAFAAYREQGGLIDDLDGFILAYPDLHEVQ